MRIRKKRKKKKETLIKKKRYKFPIFLFPSPILPFQFPKLLHLIFFDFHGFHIKKTPQNPKPISPLCSQITFFFDNFSKFHSWTFFRLLPIFNFRPFKACRCRFDCCLRRCILQLRCHSFQSTTHTILRQWCWFRWFFLGWALFWAKPSFSLFVFFFSKNIYIFCFDSFLDSYLL